MGDGHTDDSLAIAKAYAACASASAMLPPASAAASATVSTVLFPAGHVFSTGPIKLACNNSITRIEEGAVLLSTTNTATWQVQRAAFYLFRSRSIFDGCIPACGWFLHDTS